jgi:hypothetical protein
VREMRSEGLSMRSIAKKTKLSIGSVHKTLSKTFLESGVNNQSMLSGLGIH